MGPDVSSNHRLPPLDDRVDHVRGGATGRLIVEYGDYCTHCCFESTWCPPPGQLQELRASAGATFGRPASPAAADGRG
jgi:hypothetical protein